MSHFKILDHFLIFFSPLSAPEPSYGEEAFDTFLVRCSAAIPIIAGPLFRRRLRVFVLHQYLRG